MDFARFVDQVSEQAAALRAVAIAAGPDAGVPTCPGWTVRNLVGHLASTHQWAGRALVSDPDGKPPPRDEPPDGWEKLLAWWDEQLAVLVNRLRERGPDAPAWVFDRNSTRVTSFWGRRQAHETAIHRLDAEHALAGAGEPDTIPTLVFEPEFAADGIDEGLTVLIARRAAREGVTVRGTVLFHAADAGRAWLVHLRPGEPLDIGPADHPAIDTDATVAGTADAVYRSIWGRPSTAVTGGDHTLIAALRSP